jgi:outer membrane protein TolC
LAVDSAKAVSSSAHSLDQLAGLSERRLGFGQAGRMEQLMGPMARMEQVDLQNQLLMLGQERFQAEARLKRLMAEDFESSLPEPEIGDPRVPNLPSPQALKAALEKGPEITGALHHLLHMRASRKLARQGWLPDFMLQYSLVDSTNGPQMGMAMAKMNLPFLWFWRQASESEAATKDEESAAFMLDSARNEALEMAENELKMLGSAQAQLKNLESQSLPQADEALRLGLTGYRSGSLGVSDALGALRGHLMAHLEALSLKAQIGRSIAMLERLCGGSLNSTTLSEDHHESH